MALGCDAVVSCIASRTGTPRDAERADFQANQALLALAEASRIDRFILLSAICVQRPRLAFQHAKLKFERLLADSGLNYTIIRPTAFFKSLSGQFERVKRGKPFLVFGNGALTACKPISERDLAAYLVATLDDPNTFYRVLPIGGPGPAITPQAQAQLVFAALGVNTGIKSVPPALFDLLRLLLAPLGWVSEWARERQEFMRIAKYYATESMLVWDDARQAYSADETPATGTDTLADFYRDLAAGTAPVDRIDGPKLF